LLDKGKDALKDVGNEAASAAGDALNAALDIPDFYTAHLMTYCEGDFKPDAKDPNAKGNVTKCSERRPFYSFDPTAIIESKLPDGLGLKDLKWPDEVTNGIKAVNMISKAMFFFYIIGIAAAGIAIIGAVFGLLAYEHKVALANLGVNSVCFSQFFCFWIMVLY
jgi:SUR7/PalI family